MLEKELYIVHCIDTEGPLYESLHATMERIKSLTGIIVEPTEENLHNIQQQQMDLGGYEDIAAKIFSERVLSYKETWDQIDEMLKKITSKAYRQKFLDSEGNGWVYNWFIMDWVDFLINPRRRDIGYNNVYEHYKCFYESNGLSQSVDGFYWHAHPMSTYKEAHRCGNSFINSPHIVESLVRRLIDCGEFPSCFRAGFHTERPDSHWLLEQYIPFDFSNQSIIETMDDKKQKDLSAGRFGDWRRAPADWSFYHPAHDDYQVSGNCNRTIFRCLNVGTRLRLLNQEEVNAAFCRANNGEKTILAFTDHDYRDMTKDIAEVYAMVEKSSKLYPEVVWKNSNACIAAKKVLGISEESVDLNIDMEAVSGQTQLKVSTNIDSFGPQPFLGIKTKGNRYILANFDFQTPRRVWTYVFDEHSIPISDIECIGIATNSFHGTGSLKVIDECGNVKVAKVW